MEKTGLIACFADNMDELEKRVKILFSDCKRYTSNELPPNADSDFTTIRKEYYKTLEDADEKVRVSLKHTGQLKPCNIIRVRW